MRRTFGKCPEEYRPAHDRLGLCIVGSRQFCTSRHQGQCTHLAPYRLGDALAALSYLSRLSFVDSQRIAVVGSSQGAQVALKLASTYEKTFDLSHDLKFIAAVAYYPPCGTITEDLMLPAL